MNRQVNCYRALNFAAIRTAKQRVEVAKELTDIPVGDIRVYRLTHTYDLIPGRAAYVQTSILPEVLDLLVAFIQFECAEFDESYDMDQTEVADVLCNFYGAEGLGECALSVETHEIDLYINWERHCGSDVQAVGMFKRPQMKEFLKKFVDSAR